MVCCWCALGVYSVAHICLACILPDIERDMHTPRSDVCWHLPHVDDEDASVIQNSPLRPRVAMQAGQLQPGFNFTSGRFPDVFMDKAEERE